MRQKDMIAAPPSFASETEPGDLRRNAHQHDPVYGHTTSAARKTAFLNPAVFQKFCARKLEAPPSARRPSSRPVVAGKEFFWTIPAQIRKPARGDQGQRTGD